MKKLLIALVAVLLVGTLSTTAQQQQQGPRAASTGGRSAHETTSAVIDQNRVTITYGRPTSKNPRSGEVRKIWGTLVPYGKAWRMGSDEATTLITQKAITIGETTIPAGAYTLYMVPEENGTSKLAFSKTLGGWGVPVDEKNDLVRVDLKKDAVETAVEQFTMAVEKNSAGGGLIKMKWENTEYSVAFAVAK
jgi:hypothetical protein